jgi:hypothetical protein
MRYFVDVSETAVEQRLRRAARYQGLIAQKSRRNGLWYFTDDDSPLRIHGAGLSLDEAWEFVFGVRLISDYAIAQWATRLSEAS